MALRSTDRPRKTTVPLSLPRSLAVATHAPRDGRVLQRGCGCTRLCRECRASRHLAGPAEVPLRRAERPIGGRHHASSAPVRRLLCDRSQAPAIGVRPAAASSRQEVEIVAQVGPGAGRPAATGTRGFATSTLRMDKGGGVARARFQLVRRAAGLPATLQFQDPRRTALVRLAEAGPTLAQIAAISGYAIEATRRPRRTTSPGRGSCRSRRWTCWFRGLRRGSALLEGGLVA